MSRTKRPSKVLQQMAEAARVSDNEQEQDDWRDDLKAWGDAASTDEETPEKKFDRIGRQFCERNGLEYDDADPCPHEHGGRALAWRERQLEHAEAMRCAAYTGEPDGTWSMEALLRYMRLNGLEIPHARKPKTWSERNFEMMTVMKAILERNAAAAPTRWKPDATTPVLNADPETAPRASRELADRVTRYFETNPAATYAHAARELNTSAPAITACKRRILDEHTITRETPPAWVLRPRRGPKLRTDA